jgi:hypothetical protein
MQKKICEMKELWSIGWSDDFKKGKYQKAQKFLFGP